MYGLQKKAVLRDLGKVEGAAVGQVILWYIPYAWGPTWEGAEL